VRAKKLSARFEAMAGFVCVGERVADIGTDHAILPVYLVREGISPFAILTDISTGPLGKARVAVDKARLAIERAGGYDRGFDIRLGDGLSVLEEGEADTVIIAGIGAETIISILEADPGKAGGFGKYILQPRTRTALLEKWLDRSGWDIMTKTVAEERGRLCDIIVCAPKGGARKEGNQ